MIATKEDFEARYAVLSGIFIPQLRSLGLGAVPCDCGAEDCPGWQMVFTAPDRHAAGVLFLDDDLRGYEERIKC
ncbi:MAG: hypothetical protein A2Y61_00310 [Chloroflexi bacterium RBG_13_60_13]|nr:MAG: hypothetical protein A2Y61_00310 [Chloroflexi bacterium RBG_13_60_13]